MIDRMNLGSTTDIIDNTWSGSNWNCNSTGNEFISCSCNFFEERYTDK